MVQDIVKMNVQIKIAQLIAKGVLKCGDSSIATIDELIFAIDNGSVGSCPSGEVLSRYRGKLAVNTAFKSNVYNAREHYFDGNSNGERAERLLQIVRAPKGAWDEWSARCK